jgi:hypothetical protein
LFGTPVRIVLLDRALELAADARAGALLLKLLHLKVAGYGAEYQRGVLPIDATDLVGTHIAVCQQLPDGELRPLAALKSVSLAACLEYKLPFPAIPVLRASAAPEEASIVAEIVDQHRAEPDKLCYISGWSVLPDYRGSRELLGLMWAGGIGWHRAACKEWIAGAVLRFKSDQRLAALGAERISGVIKNRLMDDEEVVLMRHRAYTEEAYKLAREHAPLWNEALWLTPAQGAIRY